MPPRGSCPSSPRAVGGACSVGHGGGLPAGRPTATRRDRERILFLLLPGNTRATLARVFLAHGHGSTISDHHQPRPTAQRSSNPHRRRYESHRGSADQPSLTRPMASRIRGVRRRVVGDLDTAFLPVAACRRAGSSSPGVRVQHGFPKHGSGQGQVGLDRVSITASWSLGTGSNSEAGSRISPTASAAMGRAK